jgi:hypothetical protein
MREIIKFYLTLVTIMMINTGVPVFGSMTQSANTENVIYGLRDEVLSYFYPLSGEIISVEDGVVKVSLRGEGAITIKKGMRFSVFRKGIPFYHPTTRELIGRIEDFVGRIEIKEEVAHEGLYLCRIIKGDIKSGDIVRITSSKIKLAFFQEKKSEWELSEAFYESLKDSGRFEILESYTSTYEPKKLSELSRELGAEAFLIFSTPSKKEKRFLNVRLYWAEDAKIFAEIEKVVSPELVKALIPEREFISIELTETEPWGSYELVEGELIAMGDIDGNSIKELVVSDGNNIRIYSMKEEPQEIWFIKGSPQERHLSVDILDLNHNGRAEIFITSLIKEDKMGSFVIEYDPSQGYKRIWDNAPYFLRVIGKTLLMQRFTPFEIFSGPVYKGVWREGSYYPGKVLRLPEMVNIYGFTFVDWQNKGHPHLITFDDDGYLNLYDDNGQLIWKSENTFGKFNLSFKRKTYSVVNPVEEWFIRGRLISVNTEQGQRVIVVKKIPILPKVPGLGTKKAEVYSLWWDGETMNEELVLSGISGAITDYWVEKNKLFLIAKGGVFTFIKKAISGNFSKGSILYYYNFIEK